MRPGFFFFLPSPKVLCPEVLAVAMLVFAEAGWSWPFCIYWVLLFKTAHGANTRLCSSVSVVCSSFWRVFEGVVPPFAPGAPWDMRRVRSGWVRWGWRVSEVRGSGSVPGILQSFSVCVSHCRPPQGPGHCSCPHLLHPGRRDNKGYLWVCTRTPWCKAARTTVIHCWIGLIYFLNGRCLN